MEEGCLLSRVEINLMSLAEFIVKNFGNKEFTTEQLRKALKKKYGLSGSEGKLYISTIKEKQGKCSCMKCDNLNLPLTILRSYHTITLVDRKKNKNGLTTNRIFRLNAEIDSTKQSQPLANKEKIAKEQSYEDMVLQELGETQ